MRIKRAKIFWLCWLTTRLILGWEGFQDRAVAANAVLVGWSDTGLHETDGTDVSVYSLEPPYSTVHAQLVMGGKLVTATNGVTVTFEAVADATGSINTTSQGKGNYYQYAQALYGQVLAPDQGLAGFAMPGPKNQPQAMTFDPTQNWFTAEGIPLTPYDDQGAKNSYPMMRLVARDSTGAVLASTDVVLPVTDEMDCRACHASGSQTTARPVAGWVWDCDPVKDYKLNILRYHDEARQGASSYTDVLKLVGYNPAGLLATVTNDARPVLCLRCHASNALAGSGAPGMRPLTRLIHTKHAQVLDPVSGVALDAVNQSAACLRCHAAPETRYLRGVHHNSINPDGSLAMPCQGCHGTLTDLGAKTRQGWLDEPACQSCHTGTANHNSGQLRYTNAFATPGQLRQPANLTFSTPTNTLAGTSGLFKMSADHGGLKCAACHGPAHAEWASAQTNDNVQSLQLQGHVGLLAECGACHPTVPAAANGGPHGLHPVGQPWLSGHREASRGGSSCQSCHGSDSRGTVLALMQSDQSFRSGETRGQQLFWRGSQVGCFNCHFGPNGEGGGGLGNSPPTVTNLSGSTTTESSVALALQGSDPNGYALTMQIVSQPTNGTVSLTGKMATYFPAAGFVGSDTFTYAAWDGSTDSNLGIVTLTVSPGDCILTASVAAPTAALPGALVSYRASATLAHCVGNYSWDWDFGDGTPHSSTPNACHGYAAVGDYVWKLTVTANGLTQVVNGVVTISPQLGLPVVLTITQSNGVLTVSWPLDRIGTSLETTVDPTLPASWQPVDGDPVSGAATLSFQTPLTPDPQFFRVRRVP